MSDKEVFVPETMDFKSGSTDLVALHNLLKKSQSVAVKRLIDIMEDEGTQPKDAIRCAEILITMHKDVAKEISADKLARMVAHAKVLGHKLVPEKSSLPVIDFENVQDV